MRAGTRHAYAAVTFILLALVTLHGILGHRDSTAAGHLPGTLPPAWEAAARSIAPSQLRLRPSLHGPCRMEGIDGTGATRWHAIFSAFMTPRPVGYAGAVDLVAGFDDAGRITGIRILGHSETPTFVAGIDSDWFLEQFVGKTSDDPLEPGQDIDGLTHATVTVEAICQALRHGFAEALAHAPGESRVAPNPASPRETAAGTIGSRPWKSPGSGNMLAIFIAISAVLLQRYTGAAVAAVLVVFALGFLSHQFISLSHARLLLGESFSPQAALILCTAALTIVIARRGYCRFLCPCGRTQDLMHALSNAASHGSKENIGQPAHHPPSQARTIRGAGRPILWTSLLLLPLVNTLPLERAEAFSALFLRNLGPWGMILAVTVLAGAFLTPRFYCRKLCPLNPLFADIDALRTIALKILSGSKSSSGGTS